MKKIFKWGGIAFVILIVLSVVFGGKGNTGTTMKESFEAGMKAGQGQSPTSNASFQEISRKDVGVVENIGVLVTPGTTNIESIASEVKKTCKKQCNISIYDDKKAHDLQETYDKMMSTLATEPSDLDDWKDKNYIYVADHFVGYRDFASDSFNDYPYKDAFYDEMKAKK